MIEIFNRERAVRLQVGKDLRIVRERAGKIGAKEVHVVRTLTGGQLTIHFTDDSYTIVNFASYAVLLGCVQRWRNLHGADLWIGTSAGRAQVGPIRPSLTIFAGTR